MDRRHRWTARVRGSDTRQGYSVLDRPRHGQPPTTRDKLIHEQGLASVPRSLHARVRATAVGERLQQSFRPETELSPRLRQLMDELHRHDNGRY